MKFEDEWRTSTIFFFLLLLLLFIFCDSGNSYRTSKMGRRYKCTRTSICDAGVKSLFSFRLQFGSFSKEGMAWSKDKTNSDVKFNQ